MNVLKCTVRGNGIAVVGGEMPVVGSCNYDKIRFQFDGDWDAYYKKAFFWQEENEKIGVPLDANYEAEIPYADLDPALTLKLAVKGYTSADDLTVMRSTHTIGLKLYEGADGKVGNVGGVPDLYEQVLGQISGLAKKGVLTDCHAFEGAGVYAVANGAKNIPPVQMYSGDVATLIVSDAQNVGSGYRYQLAFFYTTSGSGCIYFKQMKEDLSSEYGWIRIDKVPPSIINNLISTSTTSALSAAQGKILNEKKVDKEEGKGLSTNDYTDAEKEKVAAAVSVSSGGKAEQGKIVIGDGDNKILTTGKYILEHIPKNMVDSDGADIPDGTVRLVNTTNESVAVIVPRTTEALIAGVTVSMRLVSGGGAYCEMGNSVAPLSGFQLLVTSGIDSWVNGSIGTLASPVNFAYVWITIGPNSTIDVLVRSIFDINGVEAYDAEAFATSGTLYCSKSSAIPAVGAVELMIKDAEVDYTLEYAPAGSGVNVSLKKDGNPQSYFCLNGRDGVTVTAPSETGNPIYISAAGKLNRFDYDASRYNADTMLEPGVYPGSYAGPSGYPFSSGEAMPILIVMETGTSPMMVDGTYDFSKAKTIMQVCFGKNGEVYSRHKIAQDTGTVADWAWSAWATKDISVLNSLTSTSTTAALSAAQGKFLNEKKVDKVPDKGLSTNDYTDADKAKVATIDLGNYGAHVFTEEDLRFAYIPEELRYRNFNLYYKGNLLSEGADYQISADQTMVDTYGTLTPAPVAGDSLYFVEKKSDKYELIKTITVEEGGIYENQYNIPVDGLNLKKAAYKVYIPKATANSIFVFKTWYNNQLIISGSIGQGLSSSTVRYLSGESFVENGFWKTNMISAMGDDASFGTETRPGYKYFLTKDATTFPRIDKVEFYSNTNSVVFPAGTVFELWGVKA